MTPQESPVSYRRPVPSMENARCNVVLVESVCARFLLSTRGARAGFSREGFAMEGDFGAETSCPVEPETASRVGFASSEPGTETCAFVLVPISILFRRGMRTDF